MTTAYLANSYILLFTIAYNIGITVYEANISSIEDWLKGYSKPRLMGIKPPTPSFERSFITTLTGDRTVNNSGQVINLNMNTAFNAYLISQESAVFADM